MLVPENVSLAKDERGTEGSHHRFEQQSAGLEAGGDKWPASAPPIAA
jgi:hypothetical protein